MAVAPIQFLQGYELTFIINIILSMIAGYIIGAEREARGKPAGISTHTLVITGSMLFSFVSALVDPMSTSRIAAQIVAGVGFIGAGMILKGDDGLVVNLTTAASIWFAAGIGMALGFEMYSIAIICMVAAFFIPRIPHITKHPNSGKVIKTPRAHVSE
ncbi:MAG: MgtC/SapB family protein [archaeon]